MLAFFRDCDILFSVMRDRIELEEVFNTERVIRYRNGQGRAYGSCTPTSQGTGQNVLVSSTNATNKRIGANNMISFAIGLISGYLFMHILCRINGNGKKSEKSYF